MTPVHASTPSSRSGSGNQPPGHRLVLCYIKSDQNLAFFGTSCPEGSAKAVVCRIADRTLMGQIAGLAMSTDNDQTPINKEIQHFIKVACAALLRCREREIMRLSPLCDRAPAASALQYNCSLVQ